LHYPLGRQAGRGLFLIGETMDIPKVGQYFVHINCTRDCPHVGKVYEIKRIRTGPGKFSVYNGIFFFKDWEVKIFDTKEEALAAIL